MTEWLTVANELEGLAERPTCATAVSGRVLLVGTASGDVYRLVLDESTRIHGVQNDSGKVRDNRGERRSRAATVRCDRLRLQPTTSSSGGVEFIAAVREAGLVVQRQNAAAVYAFQRWIRWPETPRRVTCVASIPVETEMRAPSGRTGNAGRPSPPPSPPALLVGTEEGEVYRLSRERPHWRCLWQTAAGEPVRGLLMERAAHRDRDGHTVILVGTPHRLYWLLDALLDTTGAPDARVHFLEVPSADDTPSPTPLWHRVQGALVGRVAWLADGGLLCAELRLPELADGSSRVLSNKTWIPLPSARQNDEVVCGVSLRGEYVLFFIASTYLKAAATTSSDSPSKTAAIASAPSTMTRVVAVHRADVGRLRERALYSLPGAPVAALPDGVLLTETHWLRVAMAAEAAGAETWRVHLRHGRYEEALAACHSLAAKDAVLMAQADAWWRRLGRRESDEAADDEQAALEERAVSCMAQARGVPARSAVYRMLCVYGCGLRALQAYVERRLPLETEPEEVTFLQALLRAFRGGTTRWSAEHPPELPASLEVLRRWVRLAPAGSETESWAREALLDATDAPASDARTAPETIEAERQQSLPWTVMLLCEVGNEVRILALIRQHRSAILARPQLASFLLWACREHGLWHAHIELLLLLDEAAAPGCGYREEALQCLLRHGMVEVRGDASPPPVVLSPALTQSLRRICGDEASGWRCAIRCAPVSYRPAVLRLALDEPARLSLYDALSAAVEGASEGPDASLPLAATELETLVQREEGRLRELDARCRQHERWCRALHDELDRLQQRQRDAGRVRGQARDGKTVAVLATGHVLPVETLPHRNGHSAVMEAAAAAAADWTGRWSRQAQRWLGMPSSSSTTTTTAVSATIEDTETSSERFAYPDPLLGDRWLDDLDRPYTPHGFSDAEPPRS
ncbi:hypothetical protein CDCA_CDCA03G0852 [Cyanidium caldarium]|uniref:Pep3/Vps18/deep orange domain-containing protein n=1 Tax=Cyanidium caldarium TaxID=2771 RepID=A0AAV9IRA2_CYACA|nr:hypothetical protein CDCA_CDCA03G0852 [Cyanidium caldarium]